MYDKESINKRKLKKLFEEAEQNPLPDSSGGENRSLSDYFFLIVGWDTTLAGLVSSYVYHNDEDIDLSLVDKGHRELTHILKRIKEIKTKNSTESKYKKSYSDWTENLLQMTTLLKEKSTR
ncbi:hypothetical protein HYS91_03185 [Candidatus Daviesbacteria bacterium]|nr:hypothetical protein [Candidatus Daviesbacteria bacterium]